MRSKRIIKISLLLLGILALIGMVFAMAMPAGYGPNARTTASVMYLEAREFAQEIDTRLKAGETLSGIQSKPNDPLAESSRKYFSTVDWSEFNADGSLVLFNEEYGILLSLKPKINSNEFEYECYEWFPKNAFPVVCN